MIDIYLKNPVNDDSFDQTKLDEEDPLNIYIEQLKMVLGTKTKVMGASNIDGDLEQYIFEYNFREQDIEKKVRQLISTYCTFNEDFPTTISVKFLKGTQRDIAFLEIGIIEKVRLQIMIK